jgi:glucuronoarabinoxylan endo-1,4-beta-xylanase
VAESSALAADNVVKGAVCQNLKLSADGGDFRPATAFTANQASMTVNIEGARLLMLPFAANVPAGVKVYTLADDLTLQEVTEISAHQPVLVEATGAITFTGSGDVSYAASPMTNLLRGTYVQIPLYTGDYVLGQKEGQWGLVRQTATSILAPFDVYAQVDSSDSFIPLGLTATGIVDLTSETLPDAVYYDVQGRRLKNLEDVQKGQIILIRKGGQVIKMIK